MFRRRSDVLPPGPKIHDWSLKRVNKKEKKIDVPKISSSSLSLAVIRQKKKHRHVSSFAKPLCKSE
jgi:hypothetical protein